MVETIAAGAQLDTVVTDDIPDFNEVVLYFLRQSSTSVEQFGRLYGLAIKDRPYTKARLYQMLQDKSFPADPKRRWAIAKLLQIPPVLLGLQSLDDLLPELRPTPTQAKPNATIPLDTGTQAVDLHEYRQALKKYWSLNLTSTAMVVWQEMSQRVACLEQAFLYGSNEQRKRLPFARLLCEYQMVLGNIARDQEWYDTAIKHFNRAYIVAKNEQIYAVQAAILAGRGSVFLDRASVYRDTLPPDCARQYVSLAVDDFRLARDIGKRDPSVGDKGYVQLSFGLALANTATDSQQLHLALNEMDAAEPFIGRELPRVDGGGIFVTLDEERYHLDRAAAYLSAPVKIAQYPKDARRELRSAVAAQISTKAQRRQAYNTILCAKSYLIEGAYEETTKKAQEALVLAKAIHSHVNLARVSAICRVLQTSDYGKSHIEVPALEIEVAKAKHPGLLH